MNGNCWFLNAEQNICSFAESPAKLAVRSQVGVVLGGNGAWIMAVRSDLLLGGIQDNYFLKNF